MSCVLCVICSATISVRAFRASARNEIYAADAAEKRAKAEQEAKRRAEEDERKAQAAKVNPFAVSSGQALRPRHEAELMSCPQAWWHVRCARDRIG